MVADGTYVATVDRIEGDLAIILVEDDGTVIGELTSPMSDLPVCVNPGSVLNVLIEDHALIEVTDDPDAIRDRKQGIGLITFPDARTRTSKQVQSFKISSPPVESTNTARQVD